MVSFKSIENKNDECKGKDCIKKFCESLREHAMEIIGENRKKRGKNTSFRNHIKIQEFVIFVKKNCKINMLKIKNIVRGHCHYAEKYRGTVSRRI